MRPVAAADAELACRKLERRSRERHSRPRPRRAWTCSIFDPGLGECRLLRPDQGAALFSLGWIIAPTDVHLDIAKAFLIEIGLELRDGLVLGHVRNEAKIDFRLRAPGEDRLSSRAGITGNEPLDVHR